MKIENNNPFFSMKQYRINISWINKINICDDDKISRDIVNDAIKSNKSFY